MIIYGSRTISSSIGTGTFFCPRCQMQRYFNHIGNRTWFTLYFIPLIPLWRTGAYIDCTGCGGSYAEEAMHLQAPQGPVAGALTQSDQLGDIRRTLLLTLMAANRTGPAEMSRLLQLCAKMGMHDVSPQSLALEQSQAQQAGAQLTSYVFAKLSNLDSEHRIGLCQAARQLLGGDATLMPNEAQALRELALSLQIPAGRIETLIRGG